MHYLIFDFDGVLGNTEAVRNIIVSKIDNKSMEQTLIDSDTYFSNPNHTRNHDISLEEQIKSLKWSHRYGWEMLEHDFEFFDEFINQISKTSNTKLAIVSSGNKVYMNKIKRFGLDFTHILDIFDHHSKKKIRADL